MPKYKDFSSSFTAGSTNTITVPMCSHAENDLLVAFLTAYDDPGTWASTGWTEYHKSGGLCVMYKIATGAEGSEVTFTTTTANYRLNGTIISVGDVDTAAPFDVKTGATSGGNYRGTMPAVTTTGPDRLILYFIVATGIPTMIEGTAHLIASKSGTLHDDGCSWAYKKSAGTTPTVSFSRTNTGNYPTLTLAIKPPATGATVIPVYTVSDSSNYLTPFTGGAFNYDQALSSDVTTDFGATLDGQTLVNQAPTTVAGYGVNPSHTAGKFQGSYQSAKYAGCVMRFSSSNKPNISNKNLLLHGLPLVPKDVVFTDSVSLSETMGVLLGLCSTAAVDYKWWHVGGANTPWGANRTPFVIHSGSTAGVLQSGGTLNDDSIYSVGLAISGKVTPPLWTFASLWALDTIIISGGNAANPVMLPEIAKVAAFGHERLSVIQQGAGQGMILQPIQFGDGGTNPLNLDLSLTAIEFPSQYDKANKLVNYNSVDNFVGLTYYAGASDVINHSAAIVSSSSRYHFRLHSSTSTSATYNFAGLAVIGAGDVVLNKAITITQLTINDYGTADLSNLTLTNSTILGVPATSDSLTINATTSLADCTLDVSGVTAGNHWCSVANPEIFEGNGFTGGGGHAMKLTTAGSFNITDNVFTGFGADESTGAAIFNDSGGAVTLYVLGSGNAPTVKNGVGATTEVIAFESMQGIDFAGVVTGSTVKVFATGTQTVLATPTGPDWLWSETYVENQTVDYTVLLDGYVPIRVAGLALSNSVVPVTIQQGADRAYQEPSGLTFGTTATVNTGTKRFTVTVATTGQNWYSFLQQSWRTEATLANVTFPLIANGPNSFTLFDDWEFSSGINYLSRDGMRYKNTADTQTAIWAALLSSGVPAGETVRYRQVVDGATYSAAATGEIDQLIQVYGDATHGNFDYRGFLVLKVQAEGYDQVAADAVTTYGNLEDQLYVVGLAPATNGVATGDPGLASPPVITIHAPTTWNGKDFSITITDSLTGNTGENIIKWLRYNFEQGGTFQGLDGFAWHDLVQVSGNKYKTVRGTVYGYSGLKGVRVVNNDGTTSHAGFNLFTADDGTTYAPPAAATATVVAGTRVQLYNVTTATEIDNVFVAGSAYSYIISTEASNGDTLRLRACSLGYESSQSLGVWDSSVGLQFLVSQTLDSIYAAWGIDGSTVAEYSLDGPNLQIDANDVDGASTKTRLGAYYNYALTLEIGIRQFYGAVTFLSTAAIRVNTAVANLFIENVNATTALRFTDLDVRLYKDDGTSIIATTSYSIHNDYSGVPDTVETGVSGLTGAESAQLMGLPTASGNASAVWSSATRTLTSGSGISAQDVWEYGARTLSDKAGFALTAAYDPAKVAASQSSVDLIPTTPLLASNYVAPDNAGIAAIPTNPLLTTDARLDNLNATISSRMVAADYTAPPSTASIRSELATELARIDVAVSTRATAAAVRTELAPEMAMLDAPVSGVPAAVRVELAPELAGVIFLLKSVKNKREIKKIGSAWWLLIYDDDGATVILQKELRDFDGAAITDLTAGALAQELASAV